MTHLMDPMKIVNNIVTSLYRYKISNEEDSDAVRKELKDIKKMRSLCITYYQHRRKEAPTTTWLMKKDEVEKLHKLIQNIITPT